MASSRKIYKRTGLRRDKNFADVSDSKQALNNLLNTLVDDGDATFISEDLDPIRTIFTTGITAGEYQGFIGSSVKETSADSGVFAVTPAITYQNRLDRFRVTSGEPRLNGGDGLTAKYFNQDQVEDSADVFTGITTGGIIKDDNFWESGNFDYTGKIHPQSVNAAGGVQWEGFFIPVQTGKYVFYTSSTLAFTSDFETEGYTSGIGTYTEWARVGVTTTFAGVSTTSGTDTVNIPLVNVPNVGAGMTVTASSNNRIKLGSKVVSVGGDGTVTLENEGGDSNNSVGTTILSFERALGDGVSKSNTTYTLQRGQRYRIRHRFFAPPGTTSLRGLQRNIIFTYTQPGSTSSTHLRYNSLYSLDYDFSDEAKGDINRFLDQSVLFGGNKEDGTERIGGTTQPEYVKVLTNKKVDIKYIPKESVTAIVRKTITGSWSAGGKIVDISDTTDIEVGNYIFGTGLTSDINTPVRVIQVVINKFVVIDAEATSDGSGVSLTFVNHRGFVKRVSGTGSGGNISFSSGSNNVGLKSKMLAIATGATQKYIGITTNGASVSYTPTSQSLTSPIYFYESRGLVDQGLQAFCPTTGVNETKCLMVTADASVGNTILTVADVGNVLINSTIQGFPFADGTTITGVNLGTGIISLSTGITKNIVAGSNFTTTLASEDKSLCCPPTDTSPPFNPTEEGLETISGGTHNLRIIGGNLIFDNLIATVNSSNITALTGTNNSTKRVEFKGGDGVSYNLLCE